MRILLLSLLTSGLVILQTVQSQGLTSNLESEEDVLQEAVADGFLVGPKVTPSPNKYKKQATTTLKSLNTEVSPSLPLLEESLPTIPNDSLLVNTSHEAYELTTENPNELPKNGTLTETPTLPLAENTEGSGAFSELMTTEIHTQTTLTTKQPATEMDDTTDNGSGMFLKIPHEGQNEDPISTTTVTKAYFSSSTFESLSPEGIDGSGMGSEATTSSVTTKATIIVKEVHEFEVNKDEELKRDPGSDEILDLEPTVKVTFRNRILAPRDPDPTISARAEKGTPDWLIIFAVCLTIGAILCVLAGIATKDKWFGPSRRRNPATPSPSNEEYDKKSTLPLSEKEQHLLTHMSLENEEKNKDFTVIDLKDFPEKEHLM